MEQNGPGNRRDKSSTLNPDRAFCIRSLMSKADKKIPLQKIPFLKYLKVRYFQSRRNSPIHPGNAGKNMKA
jgi:hypothetical protein